MPQVFDPVAAATAASKTRHNYQFMAEEPLVSWFAGLLALKAKSPRHLPWSEVLRHLTEACQLALKQPSATFRVGARDRKLTKAERATVSKFLAQQYSEDMASFIAKMLFNDLWLQAIGKKKT